MTILIVIPILMLLMFELGLTLKPADFQMILKRPKPVFAGLIGQLFFLPIIAFCLGWVFHLSPVFFMGVVLIACCPGGSSSNVFSMLAKGDVALSVSLTACSSIITLFTIPLVMGAATHIIPGTEESVIHLPVGKLIVQNLVLALLPIIVGMVIRSKWKKAAQKMNNVLSKIALPLLVLLVVVFYIQNSHQILDNLAELGIIITLLILLSMGGGYGLSRAAKLTSKEQKTLIIEIGMQNAAQSIAIASSPFVFNNETMAIPAIIYSLMMNIILITYVLVVKNKA